MIDVTTQAQTDNKFNAEAFAMNIARAMESSGQALAELCHDRLMAFGWKMLLPVSIANVVITSFAILRWGAIK